MLLIFDFRLINFPVFNVADVCVVIGTIFLSIIIFLLLLMMKKEVD